VAGGFHFEGLPPDTLPEQWLDPATHVVSGNALQLGPEPIIGPQEVVLGSTALPGRSLRIATDGLRPFAVRPQQP
jgi:general secretion pathway protein H